MLNQDVDTVRFSWVLVDDLKILAVDDDPIQREFCTVYLSTPTASVVTAESAEAALRLIETTMLDALLLDVEMPGMSGIELLRLLRQQQRFDDLPIMVVTGHEDMVSIDRAYDAGATAFMCKPVNWRLLSHQIRFMIRAHRAIRRAGGDHV